MNPPELNNITIRKSLLSDISSINLVYFLGALNTYNFMFDNELEKYQFFVNKLQYKIIVNGIHDYLNDTKNLSIVAIDQNQIIIGYLTATVRAKGSEKDGTICQQEAVELQSIYILPEFHGTSVAQLLLQHYETWIMSNNYLHLSQFVEVFQGNNRAIAFYHKNKFLNEEKFLIEGEIPGFRLWKNPEFKQKS